MRRVLPPVLLAVLLAGCGSPSSLAVSSGQQLADAIGCTGFKDDANDLFVADGGDCKVASGETVTLKYFRSSNARDQWQTIADKLGLGGRELVGDQFVILGKLAALQDIKAEIGGTIR